MGKIILHVDMDCFFAAIEIRENIELIGKPVIIGADPKKGKGRGVVSTCSMEARELGIHSAMPISKAYRRCPDGIYLSPHFTLYKRVSQNIMDILRSYSDQFQQISIDEAFLDITERIRGFSEAKKLAQQIKDEIYEKEGITCSIGIGTNKLIAKIGSEHEKPDGLTVVKKDAKQFLAPMPIRKLYGVGPKTEEKLKQLGIETIGDLALFNKELLMSRFGVYGLYLHLTAHGIGNEVVAEGEGRSSISKETTFPEDTAQFDHVYAAIEHLADAVIATLRRECYFYRTVGIKIRLQNFDTFTRAVTVLPTSEKRSLVKHAIALCQEFVGNKIRLVGVKVSHLRKYNGQQTLIGTHKYI